MGSFSQAELWAGVFLIAGDIFAVGAFGIGVAFFILSFFTHWHDSINSRLMTSGTILLFFNTIGMIGRFWSEDTPADMKNGILFRLSTMTILVIMLMTVGLVGAAVGVHRRRRYG